MKLAFVLLAAGNSTRFNGNKLLHNIQGKPMYRHVVDELKRLPGNFFHYKIAVTQYHEIQTDLEMHDYHVINNDRTSLGISYSIQLALHAVADPDMGFCFAVCDQPYLKAETMLSFINGYLSSGKGIGCLCHEGVMGNPAIFSPCYRQELTAIYGDVGGKQVIRRHMDDLYLHEVDHKKELEDIDS